MLLSALKFGAPLPAKFDLRQVQGKSYVSAVKNQSGGTCWTHGTMAAIESNLMMSGKWEKGGETGEPNLAEYHLDWWNNFNRHNNEDIAPEKGGLTVHEGGDYRVASAHLTRTQGAVRETDGQSFSSAPEKWNSNYHGYYINQIEWYQAGSNLENIDKIKEAIVNHGVVGTSLTWSNSFFNSSNTTFYQPPSSSELPNHAVAMVGWDDNKQTRAPKPGAWLIKNSWGKSWGESGYFWISYYDKIAGQHAEMGAISFQGVERNPYSNIYSHDTHGWRDTKAGVQEAFNHFKAKNNESLKAVSFYTAADNVDYCVHVYKAFDGTALSSMVSSQCDVADNTGFHTVKLLWPVKLEKDQSFYVYVSLSEGGHPFDRTSDVPVLLGSSARVTVKSVAHTNESYYRRNGVWTDLFNEEKTGNFCIKALTL